MKLGFKKLMKMDIGLYFTTCLRFPSIMSTHPRCHYDMSLLVLKLHQIRRTDTFQRNTSCLFQNDAMQSSDGCDKGNLFFIDIAACDTSILLCWFYNLYMILGQLFVLFYLQVILNVLLNCVHFN